MKNIKLLVIAAMLLFGMSNIVNAQCQGHTDNSSNMLNHIEKKVDLTDAQKEKIKKNDENFSLKRAEVTNNKNLTQEQRDKALSDIKEAQHKTMLKILKKDQREVVEAMHNEKSSGDKSCCSSKTEANATMKPSGKSCCASKGGAAN